MTPEVYGYKNEDVAFDEKGNELCIGDPIVYDFCGNHLYGKIICIGKVNNSLILADISVVNSPFESKDSSHSRFSLISPLKLIKLSDEQVVELKLKGTIM